MKARDLGIGIVMIIPTFVGGGALWQFFHCWSAIIAWIIVMASLYGGILFIKSLLSKNNLTAETQRTQRN